MMFYWRAFFRDSLSVLFVFRIFKVSAKLRSLIFCHAARVSLFPAHIFTLSLPKKPSALDSLRYQHYDPKPVLTQFCAFYRPSIVCHQSPLHLFPPHSPPPLPCSTPSLFPMLIHNGRPPTDPQHQLHDAPHASNATRFPEI